MNANVTLGSGSFFVSLLLLAAILVATTLDACGGSVTAAPISPSAAPSQAAASPTSTPTATTTAAAGPFTSEDLRRLVLRPAEGSHWTLVPPGRLQAAGCVDGFTTIFFTDAFLADFARSGRSLLSAALLFQTREGAHQALKVFADSRDEL